MCQFVCIKSVKQFCQAVQGYQNLPTHNLEFAEVGYPNCVLDDKVYILHMSKYIVKVKLYYIIFINDNQLLLISLSEEDTSSVWRHPE